MVRANREVETESPALSLNALLDLLAHRHRRAMLRALRDAPEHALPEDEVIDALLTLEQERTGKRPSWDHVAATLHHVHEPKLDGAGVLTHDESAETYEYEPHDQLEEWLDHIDAVHGSER